MAYERKYLKFVTEFACMQSHNPDVTINEDLKRLFLRKLQRDEEKQKEIDREAFEEWQRRDYERRFKLNMAKELKKAIRDKHD